MGGKNSAKGNTLSSFCNVLTKAKDGATNSRRKLKIVATIASSNTVLTRDEYVKLGGLKIY